jgi:DNA modification methylase
MADGFHRAPPGRVRDAINEVFRVAGTDPLSVVEIELGVVDLLGPVAQSSVRSYLNLNTPSIFERTRRGFYRLKQSELPLSPTPAPKPVFKHRNSKLFVGDCFEVMACMQAQSVEAVITDPPYGLVEFTDKEVEKLRKGRGGVWRIPPAFDGATRSPLPRFTILSAADLKRLEEFFFQFAQAVVRVAVPGANVLVASNPLLSHHVASSLVRGGLESRGAIIRTVMTMRGGDRPKNAHEEFSDVSVMPRSMWEPWLCFRMPLEGRVQDNLRKWSTGGFRRVSEDKPFGDLIQSSPTTAKERKIAPHPSLKPQALLRQLVRASLPMGRGTILDPFAGSGSTLAAASAMGLTSIGIEKDPTFVELARSAIPALAELELVDPVGAKRGDPLSVKRRRSSS